MKKYLSLLIALATLLPATSFAQTVIISPAQPINPGGPVMCLKPSSPMAYGSRSDSVTALQTFLNTQGYLAVSPTGFFGSLTLAAVKQFQGENGVPTTGYVGPLTLAAIAKTSCSTGNPPTNPVSTNPITVTSPNASSTWALGSHQTISWSIQQPQTAAAGSNSASYDITLVPTIPPCTTGTMCPMISAIAIKPFEIASKISAYGNYAVNYPWTIGINNEARTISAGSYRIEVCVTGGTTCGQSGVFSISGTSSAALTGAGY